MVTSSISAVLKTPCCLRPGDRDSMWHEVGQKMWWSPLSLASRIPTWDVGKARLLSPGGQNGRISCFLFITCKTLSKALSRVWMPIVSFSFLVSGQREGTVFPKEVTLHPGRALSKPSCGALRKSKACSVLSSLLWGEGLFVLFSGFACFNREFSSPGLDKVKVLVKC